MAPVRKKMALMHAEPKATYRLVDGTMLQRSSVNTWTPTRSEDYDPAAARAVRSAMKRDRKVRQRQQLLNRAQDAGITKSSSTQKRRRPRKKLVAADDMDEMKDALPELSDQDDVEWEGLSDEEKSTATVDKRKQRRDTGKIKMRSLKHRPGAMKRKRKMEDVEMERFGRNLAQLAVNTNQLDAGAGAADAVEDGGGGVDAGTKEKWAALRTFIGSTLERKEKGAKE